MPSDAPPSSSGKPSTAVGPDARFAKTQWSMVLRAARADPAEARQALARLCRIYWYPLYAYVRRRGAAPHDAQDLTQAFFARLLEQRTLAKADPARGKFRTFMLTSLAHFLSDEREKARAQKRGGSNEIISIDFAAAEHRFDLEPVDQRAAPDDAFDRQWALTLLATVLDRLETEYAGSGKAAVFAALKPALTGLRETQPYAELAQQLGASEGAVKVAVHRLRQRYRELVQAEIENTVASPEEVQDELRHLFRALGAG